MNQDTKTDRRLAFIKLCAQAGLPLSVANAWYINHNGKSSTPANAFQGFRRWMEAT